MERSQLNASRGMNGPLVLANGGTHFTMESVLFTRRLITY